MAVISTLRGSAPKRFSQSCLPPRWAKGGHAQTLFGHFLPSRGDEIADGVGGWTRFEIEVTGGDRLCAFKRPGESGTRVHLFHGLSGSVNSDYMRRTAVVLSELGHEVWVINHRGCGDGRGLARQPYHSGKTEDLQAVLRHSREVVGSETHVVIGVSLSGNLGLLYAGRRLEPAPDGLIAINPPVDLLHTSLQISRGLSRVYELRFLHRLKAELKHRKRAGLLEWEGSISRWGSLVDFDDRFTAPVCGFEDGRDYYRRCSSGPLLERIEVPTVILAADDDPFVHPTGFGDFTGSEHVLLHREKWGGHVGYVGENWRGGHRWLDSALGYYAGCFA